jgi:hypothetical protein
MTDGFAILSDLLNNTLQHHKCKVIFEKKDGSLREMTCTKDIMLIPLKSHPKGGRTPNEKVITAWDLDKQEWRSFIKENIKDWIVVP